MMSLGVHGVGVGKKRRKSDANTDSQKAKSDNERKRRETVRAVLFFFPCLGSRPPSPTGAATPYPYWYRIPLPQLGSRPPHAARHAPERAIGKSKLIGKGGSQGGVATHSVGVTTHPWWMTWNPQPTPWRGVAGLVGHDPTCWTHFYNTRPR